MLYVIYCRQPPLLDAIEANILFYMQLVGWIILLFFFETMIGANLLENGLCLLIFSLGTKI